RLHRNDAGLWELYVAGDPLARGLTNGKLTEELLEKQEAAFVGKLAELVPSRSRQRLLHGFLRFFNRRLVKHVPPEYQAEIYGLSQSASHAYDFIAPPYQRLLYFHGAHDIGHALQDLADRKSTRLNSSHVKISYAVFCLKKKSTEHADCDGT